MEGRTGWFYMKKRHDLEQTSAQPCLGSRLLAPEPPFFCVPGASLSERGRGDPFSLKKRSTGNSLLIRFSQEPDGNKGNVVENQENTKDKEDRGPRLRKYKTLAKICGYNPQVVLSYKQF